MTRQILAINLDEHLEHLLLVKIEDKIRRTLTSFEVVAQTDVT